mmetsp:Transcript_174/g.189  ORF Transcript_174/g.189 Transcript_174/m.189 type:complete len:103 (+) Transcript_174:757-1065(+)
MLLPYSLMNSALAITSNPFTLCFSNTPGLLRPITISGKKSIMMQVYIQSSGKCGLAFSCISYVDYFKICCVSDVGIIKDPQILVDLLEKNIRDSYKLAKGEK